jgi:LacI family transcriptional regulator
VHIAKRSVSMQDVAARAGVSVTTVSHVLNDVPGKRIRPDTRDRVRLAAEDLGYVVNGVARSLRTRRSHAIAMIGDAIAITPHAVRMVLGAHEAASRLGWLLLHTDTGGDRSFELAEIQALQQRQVDGFLYARLYAQQVTVPAALNGLATVLVDATCSDPAISSVVPDDFGGGRTATSELLRHGHTKIAFINNAEGIPAAHMRLAGYRSALEEAGVAYRADYVVDDVPDAVGGLRAASTLLDLDDPPQAIFCFNDRMTMGVYHAAHEHGLRIPDELSIVGFDNQDPIVDGLFPGLTTVALPHYEMGAWGVRTLIDQIEHPQDNAASQVSLACPLISRESVATPAESGQNAAGPGREAGSSGNRSRLGGRRFRVLR